MVVVRSTEQAVEIGYQKGNSVTREFINAEIKAAMRAQDKPRLSVLRLVKNEIDVQEKDQKRELADAEVVATFKKVLKQTTETLEASIKAGTDAGRTAALQQQVDILEGYLPAQVTGDDLLVIIDRVVAESGITEKREMGKAIGLVVAETGGNCDKAEVARIIGARLG